MSLYYIEAEGGDYQHYVEANSMEKALDVFKKWTTEDEETPEINSVTLICLEDVIRAENKGSSPQGAGSCL